jgi:hypothetical protein
MGSALAELMLELLRGLNSAHMRKRAAVAGASQLRRKEGNGSSFAVAVSAGAAEDGWANSCRSSFADGRRGCHERNPISNSFISVICCSFQAGLEFLQAIAITARGGVGRNIEQLADLLERMLVPNL